MTQNDSSDNKTEIGGDSIQAGNISDSTGVIVGNNNTQYVTIVQNGKTVRLPLQRPPRAQYFQARQAELDEIRAQLVPGNVATICGAGGMGKSALAAEVIWTLAPNNEVPSDFPDGIVFHSFYNQPQAASALENIATSFGEESLGSPEVAAQRALSQRTALLVLDGAEDADDLGTVLAVRNNCGVLITTRDRGDAQGHRLDLKPLAIDDAVRLLRKWAAGETIADTDADEIVELVGRLPLAVRLAGRYLAESGFGASNFVGWLADSPLTALDQGDRRERSVPLLLTRSMEQVSEQAQETLALIGWLALAPFPSAAIVQALQLESPWMAMQALGDLVKFGLLQKMNSDDGNDDSDAYAVSHALIHTYARKQMQAKPEPRTNLVTWLNETVRANQDNFDLLGSLRTHVVTLQGRCAENAMWDEVDLLAWAIEDYLDLQGIWADRLSIIHTAIEAAQADNNRITEGSWLGNLGNAYRNLGEVERAIGYYEQALAISREIGQKQGEGNHLGNLGIAHDDLGEVEKAIGYYEQALAIAREIGHKQGEGTQLRNLGIAYRNLGEVEKAIGYYERALAIAREIGHKQGEGTALGNLGLAHADLGEVRKAIGYYEQTLAIFHEISHKQGEGSALGNLGNAYLLLGEMEKAICYHEQALAISRETGHKQGEGLDLGNLGIAYRNLGEVEKAISYYEQALAIAREIGHKQGEGLALGNLGNAYYSLGEMEKAIEYYQQALAISREIGHKQGEGLDLGSLGIAYRNLGEVEKAIGYYQQALTILREIGDRRGEGACLGNLGLAHYSLGEVEKAIGYYQQALAILCEIGDRRGEGTFLGNLGLAYYSLGEMEKAIGYYQQALAILCEIGDRRGEGAFLGNLGSAYADLGEMEKAIGYHQQALAISLEVGYKQGEGTHLDDLGSAYRSLGEVEKAIGYYEQALAISR